jgi:DNA-binding HxlR family transcriptional regulator
MPATKKISKESRSSVAAMVESIIGCKWSLHVLACIRNGVNRPGAIERSAEGLSAKVLSERLDKLVRFGIVEKRSFPQVPPRVEYSFTSFGEKFLRLIDEVELLEADLANTRNNP